MLQVDPSERPGADFDITLGDDLYDEAVAIVRSSGSASVSQLQRRLQIGYNRAASLIEAMERAGIVGPATTAGAREVISPPADGIDIQPGQTEALPPIERGEGRKPVREVPDKVAAVAADQLRSFVERIERLEEEKRTILDDIKDVYAEAKGNGYDVKILRQVIRTRKQDKAAREEMEAILDLYLSAMGMGYGRSE
jgi:uncharacterized protein (UPF0335 family)